MHPAPLTPAQLRARFAAALVLAAAAGPWLACGAPTPPPALPSASSAPVSSAPAARASASAAPSASAASHLAPMPTVEVPPGPCNGAQVSLSVAMELPACAVEMDDAPTDPATLPLTITATPLQEKVAPGAALPIAVVFTNTGDAPITLLFSRPIFGGLWGTDIDAAFGAAGLGLAGAASPPAGKPPSGKSGQPAPPPAAPPASSQAAVPPPDKNAPTAGFGTTATTLGGESVEVAKLKGGTGGYGILGMLAANSRERDFVKIVLAAHGKAEARAEWKATGYDPAKTYGPPPGKRQSATVPLFREPLPAGDYNVTVTFPKLRSTEGVWYPPAVTILARVAK